MITAPELEIAVLILGMVILMFEAFAATMDKRLLAFAGILGLAAVLVASFFVVPSPVANQATGFWSFYTADSLSIFFKRFALLTTILVLIMMIDYASVVRSSVGTGKVRIYSASRKRWRIPTPIAARRFSAWCSFSSRSVSKLQRCRSKSGCPMFTKALLHRSQPIFRSARKRQVLSCCCASCVHF